MKYCKIFQGRLQHTDVGQAVGEDGATLGRDDASAAHRNEVCDRSQRQLAQDVADVIQSEQQLQTNRTEPTESECHARC